MATVFIAHPILLALFGATIGVLSGLFGVGGGFVLTPLLHVVFHAPFNVAVGTGIAAITVATAAGAVSYHRRSSVHWPVAVSIAGPGLATAWLGAYGVERLKGVQLHYGSSSGLATVSAADLWISAAYVVILGIVGSGMIVEAMRALRRPPREGYVETAVNCFLRRHPVFPSCVMPPPASGRVSLWPAAGLGAVGGLLSGFLGIGGGALLMPALIYCMGLPTQYATGTTLAALVWISMMAAAQHWANHNVSLASAAVLAVGAAIGAPLGARLVCRLRGAYIRQWLGIVILLTCVSVAVKLFIRLWG